MSETEKRDEPEADEDAECHCDDFAHAMDHLDTACEMDEEFGTLTSNGCRLNAIVMALVGIGEEMREINTHLRHRADPLANVARALQSVVPGILTELKAMQDGERCDQETCETPPKVCPFHGTMLADEKPCPLCGPEEAK